MFKRMLFALVVFCSMNFAGFADELLDVCFQFQTLGDDCYEDGTMLEEGECYALVWRHNDLADSIEDLFDNTGAPVNADKCEILGVFNTATWGEDQTHVYAGATNSWIVLPRGHYAEHSENGVYSVFVFDTRTWDGSKWILGGKTSETTVASLRSYGLVTDLEDIKLGTGVGGTFFSYNVGMYGTAFVGNPNFTSTGDLSIQYSCTDTPVVNGEPTDDRVPYFSSMRIENGKAILCVTNTSPKLMYDISRVANIGDAFSTTNWVNDAKQGVGSDPLTWTIDLLGEPQGFFRVLPKK